MIIGTYLRLDNLGRLHTHVLDPISEKVIRPAVIRPGTNHDDQGWSALTSNDDPCHIWSAAPDTDDWTEPYRDLYVKAIIEATGATTDRTAESIRVLGVLDPSMLVKPWRLSRRALQITTHPLFRLILLGLLGLITIGLVAVTTQIAHTLYLSAFDQLPSWTLTIMLILTPGVFIVIPALAVGMLVNQQLNRQETLACIDPHDRTARLVENYPEVTVHRTVDDLIKAHPPTLSPERDEATSTTNEDGFWIRPASA